jgi:DNA-directed RNA polymerase subunit RPC12/RpoP
MIHFHHYRRFETKSGYYIVCTRCNKRRLIAPKVSPFYDKKGTEIPDAQPPPPMWLMRPPLDSGPQDVVESDNNEQETLA